MINIDIKEVERRNRIIDNAIIKLKEKFIGVDEQIDEIMNNVRTWYCYPQLQERPCVINLWGMSGCSKTDSVRTIANLLDIEEDLMYFNFADINEKNAWEIEREIEDTVGNNKSNRFIVYDEFQYAATLNKKSEEKDNKGALKPFWELLDTGILNKKLDGRTLFKIYRLHSILKRIIDSGYPLEYKNGIWLNGEEYLKNVNTEEERIIREIFNRYNNDGFIESERGLTDDYNKANMIRKKDDEVRYCGKSLIFDHYVFDEIIDVYDSLKGCTYNTDGIDIRKKINSMTMPEIVVFLEELYKVAIKGYKLNFKNSIVFVIGNLDEAYNISFDVDPDMSPDQFHEMTKKITIVDIKEALQSRFRNEQIARLGNIHVIYPSFSSSTFKKIIEQQLDKYAAQVYEQINCKVIFDKSINNILYREGVFPTHGTRPVFSTIQEIVKSRLPEIIQASASNNNIHKICKLLYSYRKGYVKVVSYDDDNNVLDTIRTKIKLRVDKLRLSTCDESQSLCAVHESGHFVVHMNVFGKYPSKLVSRTADSNTDGFLMKDTNADNNVMKTINYYYNTIKVLLGGYVAEEIVFGEDKRTNGAMSDLIKATETASDMVKYFGFYTPYVTEVIESTEYRKFVVDNKSGNVNKYIITMIKTAIKEVKELFFDEDYREMLKSASEYLSTHSEMPRNKMKELYSLIPSDKKTVCNDRFYRDTLRNFK